MILVLVVLKNEKLSPKTSTLVYTYYFITSNITGDLFFPKYKNDPGQLVAFSFGREF
jgi:hypothetical protein